MRICFITTGNIKDIATSKRALGMANPLIAFGWDVHILMEDAAENKKRVALECCDAVQIHYFPRSGALKEIRYKNKLLKQIQPDYIYICAFVTRNIVGIAKPYVKLVEHSELQSGISDIKKPKKILVKFLEFYSLYYADGLLCASKYLVRVYREKSSKLFKTVPINYFSYAYSTELCIPKDINELTDNFKKLQDKKNIVFLGTIARNYGAFTMLEAFRILAIENRNIRLILLGKGRHYQEAADFVKENKLEDSIYMPGFIEEEDITNYFSIATAFLSPMNDTVQDWARCPSKLYMYLPYKKPIITCRIGEPIEVLREAGFYYNSGSATSLASIISKIIDKKELQYINPELHNWEYRTKEFDIWIKEVFVK